MTIRAVFENGEFRPTDPVNLTDGTVVDLQVTEDDVHIRSLAPLAGMRT